MKFIRNTVSAVAIIMAISFSASAADIELKLAHSWPKGFPIFGTSVDEYAAMVSEMSDGKIEIKVDSRNKHKSAFGLFDFVKSGQYDIGQSAFYYYGGKDPDTLFFTTMPFGMTALEQYAWFHQGGGLELANKVYAQHSIEVMTGGNTTLQMGGWFNKEINSVKDLEGLKMRIPGFGGKIMAGVGAVPTNIPAGELYQALERGTIDALEWVGPSLDLRMGFHKVAPLFYTGWHEPSIELMYFFNKSKMDSLPEWARWVVLNAAKLTGFNMTVQSQHELDDLGLMAAVESLVDQFRLRTGIEVELVKVPFRNLLEKTAKTALYRVTQEAFTNIERHAEATHVKVIFELSIDQFRLTISDNGVGFEDIYPTSSSEHGLGLRNMAERMSYFKGSFDISQAVRAQPSKRLSLAALSV